MHPRRHFESPPREFSRVNSSSGGGKYPKSPRRLSSSEKNFARGWKPPRLSARLGKEIAEKGGREEEGLPRGAGTRERVACINKSAVRAAGGV